MKPLLMLTCALVLLASETPRARFQNLKSEARGMVLKGDLTAAEARYLELLELAGEIHVGPYEVYADVVTPLAQIYKAQEDSGKLERLYSMRVETARPGLELGLAQADLGFFFQNSEVSADRFHGEQMVAAAIRTFEQCSKGKHGGEECLKRLADTAGLQGAVYFQQSKFADAEPLLRRVLSVPERDVQKEVLLVSMHALRGILVLKRDYGEARTLEVRAAAIEAANPDALARVRGTGERSRSR